MTPLPTGIEHSDREVSDFLLRACHDLRSSSRTVRAHCELLLKDGEAAAGSTLERRLLFVTDGAKKLNALIDSLTSYSLALTTEAAKFQAVRLDILLRAVLQRLDADIRGCGAEVTYGSLPEVNGNPDRLMQVFENLTGNAIVHRGEAAPRIRIEATRQTDGWWFTVRDNGPGMEEADLERIFLPFERLRGKQHNGSGLGLTICRLIVERHGGRIWAESKPDEGATFYFTLPEEP
jgi:light-regulated signal transduction histidine kinase (bacteriophytochrome)